MIKAVFIDIDGTLVNSKKEITEKSKDAIKKCIKNNIKIILASGRSRLHASEKIEQINGSPYSISSNGADAYDLEKNIEIYSESIPKKILNNLLKYADENDYKIALNYDFELIMNKAFYPDEENKVRSIDFLKDIINTRKIVQCIVSNKDMEKMKKFKEYLHSNNIDLKIENESKRLIDNSLPPSKHYFCDLVSKKVSKGEAVKRICNYLGLKDDEIAVIGDGINDVAMFELTKYSVAMENASAEVKKSANYVTNSNDEDGVANILYKILNNEM